MAYNSSVQIFNIEIQRPKVETVTASDINASLQE